MELDKTPIYLIPANPFQKLIWASMTTIIRPFIEGIIMFAILCAVLQANPLLAFVCAIVYGTTGLLYTCLLYTSEMQSWQTVSRVLRDT